MGRLDGKVALVTGSGGGIGRAVALSFVHEGARVVGCELHEAGARATAELAAGAPTWATPTSPAGGDRFLAAPHLRRLDEIRAAPDPDGRFCSYLTDDRK